MYAQVVQHISVESQNVETDSEISRLMKTLSESFDVAQDERRGFEIVDDFSVHAEGLEAFRTFFQQPTTLGKRAKCREHEIDK